MAADCWGESTTPARVFEIFSRIFIKLLLEFQMLVHRFARYFILIAHCVGGWYDSKEFLNEVISSYCPYPAISETAARIPFFLRFPMNTWAQCSQPQRKFAFFFYGYVLALLQFSFRPDIVLPLQSPLCSCMCWCVYKEGYQMKKTIKKWEVYDVILIEFNLNQTTQQWL